MKMMRTVIPVIMVSLMVSPALAQDSLQPPAEPSPTVSEQNDVPVSEQPQTDESEEPSEVDKDDEAEEMISEMEKELEEELIKIDDEGINPPVNPLPSFYELNKVSYPGSTDPGIAPPINILPYPSN